VARISRGYTPRRGKHASLEQLGDLQRVDAVVLGLAAVDGAHVQGVAEDERDVLTRAEIGHPVPGEHALDADDQVLAVGCQGVEQDRRVGREIAMQDDLVVPVEHAEVHRTGVQVDAAGVPVGLGVESHPLPPEGVRA
jgi:hypothetical protein